MDAEAHHDLDLELDLVHVGGRHEVNLGNGLSCQRIACDEVGAEADDIELAGPELQAQSTAILEVGHVRHL